MSSTGKRRSNARRALAPPTSAKRQKKTTPISSDETPAPDYEVDSVLKSRKRSGKTEYLVSWVGYGVDDQTWEPEDNLDGSKKLLTAFKKKGSDTAKQKARRQTAAPFTKQKTKPQKKKGEQKAGAAAVEDEEEEEEEDNGAPTNSSTRKSKRSRALSVRMKASLEDSGKRAGAATADGDGNAEMVDETTSAAPKPSAASKAAAAANKHAVTPEVITIDDSSDDGGAGPASTSGGGGGGGAAPAAAAANGKGKGKSSAKAKGNGKGKAKAKGAAANSEDDMMSDGELSDYKVEAASSDSEEDDDCKATATKGPNALVDFPHVREHCIKEKFGTTKMCPNCFCMVCNIVAKDCKEWSSHHKAKYSDPQWRAMRTAKQVAAKKAKEAAGLSAAAIAALEAAGSGGISVEALLKATEQVWPDEVAAPAKLVVKDGLRPYQRQSLAFMLAVEKGTGPKDTGVVVKSSHRLNAVKKSKKSIVQSDGGVKTVTSTASVPSDLEVVKSQTVRGGWIADEVGMGKTACCIALVLANPCTDASKLAEVTSFQRQKATGFAKERPAYVSSWGTTPAEQTKYVADLKEFEDWKQTSVPLKHLKLKATLVIVPPTLIGQWREEVKKFAPKLNVYAWHSSFQTDKAMLLKGDAVLMAADVIIVSTHGWPKLPFGPEPRDGKYKTYPSMGTERYIYPDRGDPNVHYHRIIIDECHEGYSGSKKLFIESNPDLASRASLRWAVTGTPISASFSDIRPVSNWLGHWGADSPTSLKMSALTQACTGSLGYLPAETKQQRLADLADALKHLMIRHTKSMQIGGEDALALPTLESETKFLDMAPYEKKIYRAVHLIARKLPQVQKSRKEGCDGFRLSMQLATMYQACTGAYSNGIATYDLTTASKIFTNDVAKTVKGKLQYAIGTPASIMPKFGSKVSLAEVRQAEEERTKLKALESDLKDLQKVEPAFHAVVFTHLADVLERVGAMARNLGVEVYEVKTALSMKQRHQQIQAFQVIDKKAKLFVATIRAGNVGINIQSATRVYLMEPAINPATEIQCAGRIHRLGQLRDVLVRRFAFRDSIEEKICSLHEKIKGGSASMPNGRVPADVVKSLTNRPDDPPTPVKYKPISKAQRRRELAQLRRINQMGYNRYGYGGGGYGGGGGGCNCGNPYCSNRDDSEGEEQGCSVM